MRIINSFSYNNITITFFEINLKFIIKFESFGMEQTYKVDKLEFLDFSSLSYMRSPSHGMNNLIRPALYDSRHKISNITSKHTNYSKYDVVGPICESSSQLIKIVI